MKGRRIVKIVLIVAILIVIGFMIAYAIPVKKKFATTLCSVDGEQIEVEFNISFNSYMFAPTKIKGNIIVNGSQYVSVHDTNISINDDGIIDRIKMKLTNDMPTQWFVPSESTSPFVLHENCIQVQHLTMDFDKIYMTVLDKENYDGFFGPAKTAEEAYEIYTRLYQ